VYESWEQDPRPVWQVSCLLEVEPRGEPHDPRTVERTLDATGVARRCRLVFDGDRCLAHLRVHAHDDLQAATASLTVLDVAARQHPPLAFGDLLWQAATRLSTSI